MLFELHLTASEADHDRLDGWIEACKQVEIKPLLIELDKGAHRKQMMMAAVFEVDSVDQAFAESNSMISYFEKLWDFEIIREKLEVPLDHAAGLDVAYYEMHVKALLTEHDARFVKMASNAGEAHASRNLLKETDDGRQKWYLTRRTYFHNMYDSSEIFDESYAEIIRVLPTVRMEREAVLLDTNPELDLGWTT